MIYCTGDIHGNYRELLDALEIKQIPHNSEQLVILLGDVGANYYADGRDNRLKKRLQESGRVYFCIHGNHERRPESLDTYHEANWNGGIVYVESDYPNILFAKDGEVYDLKGIKTLVLGGAYSVDKWYRLRNGWNWFADEQMSEHRRTEVFEKIKQLGHVDLVLSHTCPFEWQPTDLFIDGLDQSTVDKSMELWLSDVERNLDYKMWLFGHFHDDRKINDKVRMLFKSIMKLEVTR